MDTITIIAQVPAQVWTVADNEPTLDLETDLWTMTASDGRTIYGASASECAEMCKSFEIAHNKLDLYDSDGQHSAAADYAMDMYLDHCADSV